jgi:phage terminase large subunit GpA-like protein
MGVRGKLWRFVKEAIHSWESDVNMSDHITDNLTAHGVTVQDRGEWIQHCFEIECTNCRQEALRDSFNKYVFSNYCPHCGAKMMPQPPKGE